MTTVKNQVLQNVHRKLSSTFIFITPPKSPVPHLFTSNATPTEEERKLILDTIQEHQDHIVALNLDLGGDSEVNAKKLVKQIAVYGEFILRHRALLAPVRSLPPELLQEIFLLYAETSTGYHRWIRPPFIVGQICRLWRQAALTLPSLWNELPAFKLTLKTRSRTYCAFLEGLINRSGTGDTLRVYIRAPFKEVSTPHPVITTLSRYAGRIKTLTIESGTATVRQIGDAMKGNLVNLRELELCFWTKVVHQAGVPEGEVECFTDLPKLRKVSVMGRCPPVLKLPWSQIDDYREKYDGGTLNDCLSVAGTSGRLHTLEVVKNAHHTIPMVPPLTLEGVKHLRVRIDDASENAPRFFNNLTLPSVESIQVILGSNPIPSLSTMLSHSKRNYTLRKLAFRGSSTLSLSQLRTLFSCVPQLAELDMEVPDGDATFLELFQDRIKPVILPFLESLNLYVQTVDGLQTTLNEIATQRCCKTVSSLMPEPWQPLPPPTLVSTAAGLIPIPALPPVDFDLINTARPLQTFRLNFPTRSLVHSAQTLLNNWHAPNSDKRTRDAGKMNMWRRELIDAYPEFFMDMGMGVHGSDTASSYKIRGKVPKFPKRWSGLLNEIENMDPMGFDRVSLRASNLHHILGLIANAPTRYGLNSTNASYIRTAKYILDEWRLVFRYHLSEYKWAIKGGYSLVFVSSGDPVRAKDNAIDQLVYGMKDELTPTEVFWPRNL